MRLWQLLAGVVITVVATAGCASDPGGGESSSSSPSESLAPANAGDDGISLSSGSKERIVGTYADAARAITISFDLAKVDDNVFADVRGNNGREILRIETSGNDYTLSYMGGALKLHTTKGYIAQQKSGPAENVSTDSFVWEGDNHVLDDMLKLPEIASLPTLSRALGMRGFTGSDFPASLVLHKIARQSADALAISVKELPVSGGANSYCAGYPNAASSCYGMCGPGCSCWSWVCGDCCYHYGCAVHDNWCREGKWWWCYDITAVIALFGC
jgi:hypothetical protein